MNNPSGEELRPHVQSSLEEDAAWEDVTTHSLTRPGESIQAELVSREHGVLCGRTPFEVTLELLGNSDPFPGDVPVVKWFHEDGESVEAGSVLARIDGPASTILSGERVALNYLQQLSGVATRTAGLVDLARPYGVDVYDTRKTVPHYRLLQKYAVRCGGGLNHRMDLSETVMVKDNHKRLAGGLQPYLNGLSTDRPVVVEIHDTEEIPVVRQYLNSGQNDVDITVLMLDNFKPDAIRDIMSHVPETVDVEVSGGIREENLETYCEAGPDRISVGALTHSFESLDLTLKFTSHPTS